MGWHYKHPRSFPGIYPIAIREAILRGGAPVIMIQHKSLPNAKADAERFRHFRWCVKQDATADVEMAMALLRNDIRCTIRSDNLGHFLEVTAKPTKYSEFVELNPKLASEIVPLCQ